MEIYRLQTFVAVARHGHVTKAATDLHLSQPAVSGQIKALEEELGVDLFRRTAHGMELTEWGNKLLKAAEKILEAIDDFVHEARTHAGSLRGKIRLGTLIQPDFLRLGRILAAIRDQHPNIEIELDQSLAGRILHDVQKKTLDAGFYVGPTKRRNIEAIYLRKLHYCLIAPLLWKKQIAHADWRDIAKLPWVGTPKGSAYHQLTSRLLRRHGTKPSVVIEIDKESTMLNLVAAGVGLSLMREDALPTDPEANGIVVCPKGRIAANLSFIYQAGRDNDPALRALVNAVRKTWNSSTTDRTA